MVVRTKFCLNILALEGGPCAINSHEVQLATFIPLISTAPRAMADEAHSVHLEDKVEAAETVAPIAPQHRGKPRYSQATTNLTTIQRLDMLDDTV